MSFIQISRDSRLSGRPSGFACVTGVESPGVTRVTLSGELDMATAPQLEDTLFRAACDSVAVILDLGELEFMDSTGLHVILCGHARLAEANCRLVLIAGGHQVQRIFEITGTDHQLEFVNTPDAVRSG
jgi:anti-anti-sigma factor